VFVSFYFLVFLVITVLLFFSVKKTWRPQVLLATSYFICGAISAYALIAMLGVTVISYFVAIKIEKYFDEKKDGEAKLILTIAVIGTLLFLVRYKYTPNTLQLIGISFYTFQAIAYMVDVYRRKYKSEKNFVYLALFFSLFAKLISGPIERGDKLLPQLKWLEKVRFGNRARLSTAFTYMLWGYFMKMVVADRLAVTVNAIFHSPQFFDSFWLFLGAFFYTIQIYCDFAGYSYIAIGCARLFGIHLTHNFETPYCSKSIIEFWKCWHISLSSWLKEYLYIPLGGNKKGELRKYGNLIIVFVLCGIWHGVGLNFVVWGLIHGVYSVINHIWRKYHKQSQKRIWGIVSWITTFTSVMIAWIFFRAPDLKNAGIYFWRILTVGMNVNSIREGAMQLNLNDVEIAVIAVGIIVVMVMDYICNRKQIHLPELIQHRGNAMRYLIFYLLIIAIFVFGIYGPGYHAEQFIYMQF